MTDKLTPNELTLIALANEYCHLLEHANEPTNREDLVSQLLKLLPRLYITATDLGDNDGWDDDYIDPALDEQSYDLLRERLARVFADEDTYLEVFVDDMRYSDTPIAATISENLADLYQEFFNLVHAVQDMPTEVQHTIMTICRTHFADYWSQTLCNVLRALNTVFCKGYHM